MTNLPELGVISTEQKDNWYGPEDSQPQQDAARSSSSTLLSRPPSDIDDGGAHESEHYENSSAKYEVESDEEVMRFTFFYTNLNIFNDTGLYWFLYLIFKSADVFSHSACLYFCTTSCPFTIV